MFCTPPGVTGLTTCIPPDPCDGYTTDITCVTYTGQDFTAPCIEVQNGDDLITVLLAILATYFPPEVCCELQGTLSFYTTTTSTSTTTTTTIPPTTTSTTTTTTSTTTTTTLAPATCQCYPIVNGTTVRHAYSFVNCKDKTLEFGFVGPRTESAPTVVYQCAYSISADPELTVLAPLGDCSVVSCPPTTSTTTTTTIPPDILYGRKASIPVPVLPDSNLIISYFDTNGILVPSYIVPAQSVPTTYYLCIQCGSTVTVVSGTPTGTITYDDTSLVDCNCLI